MNYMHCKKCSGRVFVDRTYSDKMHLELACIECGKRWMLNKRSNPLARFIVYMENLHASRTVLA